MTDQNSHEEPPAGANTVPLKKRPKQLVAILATAVAVLAAGIAGWAIHGTEPADEPDLPSSAAAYQPVTMGDPPASPWSEPFVGLYTPDSFTVRDVWDGVAIFDLEYDSRTIDHYRRTTSVMRAVDVGTGEVLWTMSTTPDNTLISFFFQVFYEDGKLLTSIEAPSEIVSCGSSATFILLLDIRTGEILASRRYSDDCESTVTIGDYHNGIVAIEQYGAVTGYSDTDLDAIVWQDPWDPHGTPIFDRYQSSRWSVSADDEWFRMDGRYVSMDDGRVSTGSPGPWAADQGPLLYNESGAIVTMLPTGYARYHELVRWSDMDLTDRLWDYEPPPGWALYDIGCSSPQVLALDLVPSDDINATTRTLSVIDASNGEALWAISFNRSPVGWNSLLCAFTKDNHLVYVTDTTAIVADPTTGELGSRTYGLLDSPYSTIDPCGEWMCTVNFTPDDQLVYTATVMAVDVRSDPVEVHWRTQLTTRTPLWFSYTDGSHITYVGKDVDGTFRFLTV